MKFLRDFLPILLFFIAYRRYDIYVATTVLIAASVAQITWIWLRHRQIENMPLITTALVIVFGGATLFFQDETFVKWKPTVANWLFGLVFFVSQWIGKKTLIERLLDSTITLPKAVWLRLNLAWVTFFAAMGSANLFVVYRFDTNTWVNFKLFGILGLTLAFVVAQAFYLAHHLKPDPAPKE